MVVPGAVDQRVEGGAPGWQGRAGVVPHSQQGLDVVNCCVHHHRVVHAVYIHTYIHRHTTTHTPPPQVLLTSAGRVRIGSLGIPDALSLDPPEAEDTAQLQRDDLAALGNLLVALACAGLTATPSVEVVAAQCSAEFARVVVGLVSGSSGALVLVLSVYSACCVGTQHQLRSWLHRSAASICHVDLPHRSAASMRPTNRTQVTASRRGSS